MARAVLSPAQREAFEVVDEHRSSLLALSTSAKLNVVHWKPARSLVARGFLREFQTEDGPMVERAPWKPGFPCANCYSLDTYLDGDGHAACQGCGSNDGDEV